MRGREGKGREGKGRKGKGRGGEGRKGKGREGKGREGKGKGREEFNLGVIQNTLSSPIGSQQLQQTYSFSS
jgi:hypothetical protein